jgi:diguanylate cyclase (GGDEF)-like protein
VRIGFNSVEELQLLLDIVGSYQTEVHNRFHRLLFEIAPHYTPGPLKAYLNKVESLSKRLNGLRAQGEDSWLELDGSYAPYLRHAVIDARLRVARSVEMRRARTTHPELQAKLDEELRPYAQFINQPWFQQQHELVPVPQLTDFFPIEMVESQLAEQKPQPRKFDEKFHILQAPELFLYDLDRARAAASIRDLRVAVAYIDIDHFKTFNTETSETVVDRNVLPKFMRHLEAHVYQRGYAYRFGGDEYGIILHNVTEKEAFASMERLRTGLAALTYEGTKKQTTVSIGVVIVYPDCHLTGHEIQHAANNAKTTAKGDGKTGRNRIAAYSVIDNAFYTVSEP